MFPILGTLSAIEVIFFSLGIFGPLGIIFWIVMIPLQIIFWLLKILWAPVLIAVIWVVVWAYMNPNEAIEFYERRILGVDPLSARIHRYGRVIDSFFRSSS